MDQAPQPEDAAASTAHEERRADVQRRIDEAADVLAETLLGMWRAKHRAERRGEPWPPPEPPKPEAPRSSGLSERPKGPPRLVFRELEVRDEPVANMLLEMTWFPASALGLKPEGANRTRVVLEYGRIVIGVAVLDEYGDAAVLRGVAVRSTYRRRKHGSALLEFIVRRAYEIGVGRLYTASTMPWFAEEVGFEVRERAMLPEDARRLPGTIDAPRNAFVFELTPTMSGRRAPRKERAALGVRGPGDAVRTGERKAGPLRPRGSPMGAARAPTLARSAAFTVVRGAGAVAGSSGRSRCSSRRCRAPCARRPSLTSGCRGYARAARRSSSRHRPASAARRRA